MLVQSGPQRGHDLAILTERERHLEPLLEGIDAQRLQPPRLGAKPLRLGQTLQGWTAPERQRQLDRLCPRSGVALAPGAASFREQLLEPHSVDGHVSQRVTVGRTEDRLLSEGGAQSRDMVLQRVPRRGGQLLAPEGIDQLVHRDDPAVAQRKHREQAMALAAAHSDRTSTQPDLERPE